MTVSINHMSSGNLEATKHFYVGIFADEKALQFLDHLHQLSDQCFQELHQVAVEKAFGTKPLHLIMPSELVVASPYGAAFTAGLQAIRNWNSSVLQQEVQRMKQKCTYAEDLYKYTVVRYLQEIFRHEKPQTLSLNLPPLRDFLHLFYIQIANNPITKNLKYFATFGMEKKNMLMDAVRNAFFKLLETQMDHHPTQLQFPPVISSPPSNSNFVFQQVPSSAKVPLRPWVPQTPVQIPNYNKIEEDAITEEEEDLRNLFMKDELPPPVVRQEQFQEHPSRKKEASVEKTTPSRKPDNKSQRKPPVSVPTPIPSLETMVQEMRKEKARKTSSEKGVISKKEKSSGKKSATSSTKEKKSGSKVIDVPAPTDSKKMKVIDIDDAPRSPQKKTKHDEDSSPGMFPDDFNDSENN